jgi:uncharacterized damage-inducible protein DinB
MDTHPKAQSGTATDCFLDFSRTKLMEQYWPRLRRTIEPLSAERIWWRPNRVSNSIGNLILHLNGNVQQWMVASFSGLEDARNRPAEFDATGGRSAAELLNILSKTIDEARTVLARLTTEDLLASYEIQGYTVTGLAAVYQVVEHFGMHYGQIIYVAKMLEDRDLGFYSELSKTGRAP